MTMPSENLARRTFLKTSLLATASLITAQGRAAARSASAPPPAPSVDSPDQGQGELLYNGIRLPREWPPRNIDAKTFEPPAVPYLSTPPRVIRITVGRQLFVDDFLIDETNLKREFHYARKYESNPVLKPETALEHQRGLPVATPKGGGVWWDPKDKLFKMWYEAGWLGTMAYATSKDGINWERTSTPVHRVTNGLLYSLRPDSTTVFLDHFASDPSERFKLFMRGPGGALSHGYSMTSPDGIHWNPPVPTGELGDRSTMFYNPFRQKWVYSVRSSGRIRVPGGRARYYREHSDFLEGAQWTDDDLVFWTKADRLDPADPEIRSRAQLYNLDAVAYESLMISFHQIHRGPGNRVCMEQGIPKITELNVGYSRDGFHWDRPDRETFIASTRKEGDWDRGYVQSVGGVCLIVGDELWFYYTGFRGDPDNTHEDWMLNGMYANGSTGIAKLRRDGFASMSAGTDEGVLTTRAVTFDGEHLFVNVNCPKGALQVELLDLNGQPIEGFAKAHCRIVAVDSTLHHVRWEGDPSLRAHAGQPVRFRFYLRQGDLYAFWVSPELSGASHGYVGAGGPGFTGGTDTVGLAGYAKAPRL
jgi:hypothetical protein